MHVVQDRLLLSPSDLIGFLACEHLTQLELAEVLACEEANQIGGAEQQPVLDAVHAATIDYPRDMGMSRCCRLAARSHQRAVIRLV